MENSQCHKAWLHDVSTSPEYLALSRMACMPRTCYTFPWHPAFGLHDLCLPDFWDRYCPGRLPWYTSPTVIMPPRYMWHCTATTCSCHIPCHVQITIKSQSQYPWRRANPWADCRGLNLSLLVHHGDCRLVSDLSHLLSPSATPAMSHRVRRLSACGAFCRMEAGAQSRPRLDRHPAVAQRHLLSVPAWQVPSLLPTRKLHWLVGTTWARLRDLQLLLRPQHACVSSTPPRVCLPTGRSFACSRKTAREGSGANG